MRLFALSIVGVMLVWLVLSRSLSAFVASQSPEQALVLYPDNYQAKLEIAESALSPLAARTSSREISDALLERSQSATSDLVAKGVPFPMIKPALEPDRQDAIRALISDALVANPLSSRAYRLLAEVAPSDEQTMALLLQSVSRSKHEVRSLLWLMQQSYLDRDFRNTAGYGDILLRAVPELYKFIVPLMARVAEAPDGVGHIEALLKNDPPWRWYFFDALKSSTQDLRTPQRLLLFMRAQGLGPLAPEVDPYIALLINRDRYDIARETWLALLPSDRSPSTNLLYNDRFLYRPTGLAFDWTLGGGGIDVEFGERDDKPGQRVLEVRFVPGLTDPRIVRQTLMLAPGAYSLKSNVIGRIEAHRGVRWSVACLSAPFVPIARSEPIVGFQSDWRSASMNFRIPANNCSVQTLQLAVDVVGESDRNVSGKLSFSDVSLKYAQ